MATSVSTDFTVNRYQSIIDALKILGVKAKYSKPTEV